LPQGSINVLFSISADTVVLYSTTELGQELHQHDAIAVPDLAVSEIGGVEGYYLVACREDTDHWLHFTAETLDPLGGKQSYIAYAHTIPLGQYLLPGVKVTSDFANELDTWARRNFDDSLSKLDAFNRHNNFSVFRYWRSSCDIYSSPRFQEAAILPCTTGTDNTKGLLAF
jgi:hypothetical protein